MKSKLAAIIGSLLVVAAPFSCTTQTACGAEPRAKETPKKHFPLGYVPDKHFPAGVKAFEATTLKLTPVLQSVDLRAIMPPDDDQGQVGRCTGFGLSHAMYAALAKTSPVFFSPNFIYWNERFHMGTVNEDSGARIGEDGIFTLQSQGACLLDHWTTARDWTQKPPQCAYDDALTHLVLHCYKVDNHNGQDLERAMSSGFVVVYGIRLRSSFEDFNTQNFLYKGDGDVIGGHCMVMFKYDLGTGLVRTRNQWGAQNWGDRDEFDMPLWLAHGNDVDDCYVIDLVKAPAPLPTTKRKNFFSRLFHL